MNQISESFRYVEWRHETIQCNDRATIIMVGRKRKRGYREPNGRPQRPPAKGNRTAAYLDALILDPTAIYVLENGSLVKIGRSSNPQGRSNDIQVGNGQHVRMVWHRWLSREDAVKLEGHIHRTHKGTDIHSMGEWYWLSAAGAIDLIERHIRQLGLWSCSDEIAREAA